jgi:hypothetical protein
MTDWADRSIYPYARRRPYEAWYRTIYPLLGVLQRHTMPVYMPDACRRRCRRVGPNIESGVPLYRRQPNHAGIPRLVPTTRCVIRPTPQGRGYYVVIEEEEGDDVLVLAPPGVRIPTEAGTHPPLCSEGWRLARFSPVDGQSPLLDQHRPTSVFDIGVRGALVEIFTRCSEHSVWLADRIEEIVRSAWMISQPDVNGDVPVLASQRVIERDEMLDELVAALQDLASALPTDIDKRFQDPYYFVELRDELDLYT